MKRLLVVLMACSLLFLGVGCGKPKATEPGASKGITSDRDRREQKETDQQNTQGTPPPAGGAARQ